MIFSSYNNINVFNKKNKQKLVLNEYKDEKSLIFKTSDIVIKNRGAIAGMKSNQKKHHSGNVKLDFIKCNIERSKTKLTRRRTLFKKVL
jgi:hypothetical protein